jgi:hypothetical protein
MSQASCTDKFNILGEKTWLRIDSVDTILYIIYVSKLSLILRLL